MTDRELMQQALDALEYAADQTKPEDLRGCDCLICTTIPALRGRLEQLKPLRPWVELTDEDLEAMAEKYVTNCYFDTLKYARAIEAKLKEQK
jgi:hypothetical protein